MPSPVRSSAPRARTSSNEISENGAASPGRWQDDAVRVQNRRNPVAERDLRRAWTLSRSASEGGQLDSVHQHRSDNSGEQESFHHGRSVSPAGRRRRMCRKSLARSMTFGTLVSEGPAPTIWACDPTRSSGSPVAAEPRSGRRRPAIELTPAASVGLDWFSVAACADMDRVRAVADCVCIERQIRRELPRRRLHYGLHPVRRRPLRDPGSSAAGRPSTLHSYPARACRIDHRDFGLNVSTAWYLGGTGAGIGLLVIVAASCPYF